MLKNVVTPEPKSKMQTGNVEVLGRPETDVEAATSSPPRKPSAACWCLRIPLRGQTRITNSLFAGIQLIMPGEVAGAHQHVASAIRFVLDGEGAYTAVQGRKGQHVAWRFHPDAELGAA